MRQEPKIRSELNDLLTAEMELRKTPAKLFDANSSGGLEAAVAGRYYEAVQRIESLQRFLEQC